MTESSSVDYAPENEVANLNSLIDVKIVGQRIKDDNTKDKIMPLPTLNITSSGNPGLSFTCNNGKGMMDSTDNLRIYTISNSFSKRAVVYITIKYTKSTD